MADGSSDSEPEVTGMAGANMSAPPRGIPVLASAAAVYNYYYDCMMFFQSCCLHRTLQEMNLSV